MSNMVFCRGCGTTIHESASACPKCGAVQKAGEAASTAAKGTLWPSIVSLVLGVLVLLSLLDDSEWDADVILGLVMFSIGGIVTGAVAINKRFEGRGMAIAGVVMSSIGLLCLIGLMVD